MKLSQKIRYRGSLWSEILPETNVHMRKEGYVVLAREPRLSVLKRYGQDVGAIDAKPENLPARVRHIAEDIVSNY